MKVKSFAAILALLLLTSCGPIIGNIMVSSTGVKDFEVESGSLSDLKPGSRLLVVAPFATTPESFYICRGEDTSMFVSAFNETGLFAADFHMPNRFDENTDLFARLEKSSPSEIRSLFNLADAPQILLTGTILHRETVAAPTKGVIMNVTYRLAFTDLESGRKTVVDISVKDLFQDCIPTAVRALTKRIAG